MTHVLQGVIHGKTLLLSDDPGLCDGESVEVVIRPISSTPQTTSGNSAAGLLANLQGADDDLAELYRYRHSEHWREVEP